LYQIAFTQDKNGVIAKEAGAEEPRPENKVKFRATIITTDVFLNTGNPQGRPREWIRGMVSFTTTIIANPAFSSIAVLDATRLGMLVRVWSPVLPIFCRKVPRQM